MHFSKVDSDQLKREVEESNFSPKFNKIPEKEKLAQNFDSFSIY